jgi:hypothetical protein
MIQLHRLGNLEVGVIMTVFLVINRAVKGPELVNFRRFSDNARGFLTSDLFRG